jgi:hypothetical protein
MKKARLRRPPQTGRRLDKHMKDNETAARSGGATLCVPASSGCKPPSMSGALDMDPPQMLDAALLYAARGWPVFPCHPQTKRPLLKPDIDRATGAEIPNTGGLKKASTDPEPIRGGRGFTADPRRCEIYPPPCRHRDGGRPLD